MIYGLYSLFYIGFVGGLFGSCWGGCGFGGFFTRLRHISIVLNIFAAERAGIGIACGSGIGYREWLINGQRLRITRQC